MNSTLLLAVDQARFLRPHEKRRLFARVVTEEEYARLSIDAVATIVGRPLSTAHWNPAADLRTAALTEKWVRKRGVELLLPAGNQPGAPATYPERLQQIFDPPFILYARGETLILGEVQVAVVGTRRPATEAGRAAFAFGVEATEAGHPVVSGLARGIDAMVHRGALSAGGGGVVVLGSGIDHIYPRENRELARGLLERGGVIVSEYGPGVPPLKYHFPARNRIISGLVRMVLVVQAPARSGALITVDHALDQGREVCVHAAGLIPAPSRTHTDDAPGRGGAELAENGAPVIERFGDVATLLGLSGADAGTVAAGAAHPGQTAGSISLAERMARQLSLGQEFLRW